MKVDFRGIPDNCHKRHNHGGVPFSSRCTSFSKETAKLIAFRKVNLENKNVTGTDYAKNI